MRKGGSIICYLSPGEGKVERGRDWISCCERLHWHSSSIFCFAKWILHSYRKYIYLYHRHIYFEFGIAGEGGQGRPSMGLLTGKHRYQLRRSTIFHIYIYIFLIVMHMTVVSR